MSTNVARFKAALAIAFVLILMGALPSRAEEQSVMNLMMHSTAWNNDANVHNTSAWGEHQNTIR